jgi:hypothetical protein
MTPEDLEAVVARTGHERYRWLTSDANPDVAQRDAYRELVVRLAREDVPPGEYPPLHIQAGNLAKAAVRFAASGFKTADRAEYDRRRAICAGCELFDAERKRCIRCGCRTDYKLRMASEHCPLDPPKW